MGRLTEKTVQSAKPGRHGDGDGLQLVVSKGRLRSADDSPGSGTPRKKWVLRYQIAGARRDMGLGSYPDVGLKDARLRAAEARGLIARGLDPIEAREAARKAAKPVPTFREVAALVIADAKAKSTNAKVRYQWERHLGEAYSGPLLERPVNEITTLDIAGVLRPIWRTKPEVARKLYPGLRRVFERARIILRDEHGIAMPDNPARWDDLKAMGFEAPARLSRGRHPSLPHAQMPAFVAELRARDAIAARALEFLILTNVRTDAVLNAAWANVSLKEGLWTVPLANLKDRAHREDGFRVPLSARAIEILGEMQKARVSDLVFPGQKNGRPFSNMALLTLLKRMNAGTDKRWSDPANGKPVTAHGFRATFRTWAEEVARSPMPWLSRRWATRSGARSKGPTAAPTCWRSVESSWTRGPPTASPRWHPMS
jgi:integrase